MSLTTDLPLRMAPTPITLRFAMTEDVDGLRRLAGQLGYVISDADVLAMIESSLADAKSERRGYPAGAIFVACEGDTVRGWMEVRLERSMLGSYAEIVGLIVDGSLRGQGIGSDFVDRAAQWAQSHGETRLRVRANTRRTRAATFYQGRGFIESKQQRVFERVLSPSAE